LNNKKKSKKSLFIFFFVSSPKDCLESYFLGAFNGSSLYQIWQNLHETDSHLTIPRCGHFWLIDTTMTSAPLQSGQIRQPWVVKILQPMIAILRQHLKSFPTELRAKICPQKRQNVPLSPPINTLPVIQQIHTELQTVFFHWYFTVIFTKIMFSIVKTIGMYWWKQSISIY